ncbi:MAG: threonine--tRNA ligase [bacterium]|nr:threonine--tRNA ligase [bacterium]
MKMQNNDLEILRHSASHILAAAVKKLYPETKLGIGPAIENGFYYDFDMSEQLVPEDFGKIEAEMKKIAKSNQKFETFTRSKAEAIRYLEEQNEQYKVELVNDLPDDEVTFYQNGDFVDLCRGPHLRYSTKLKHFKLLSIAGAYWRGDEKKPMLQRIYGTAFTTKEDLVAHLAFLEEARKRDHRVIGKHLDLFSINDEAGSGLVLWHPKGAHIRHLLETFWKDEHFKAGYELLYTPHLGKAQLWDTSGHLGFYNENMYSAMQVDSQDYFIRPMNCPFHILIYKSTLYSFRDLPLRWAELGTVYRYEKSGVLHGLMRARGFTQDDAHIVCTAMQMEGEIKRVLEFCLDMLRKFGFSEYKIFLSTRPSQKFVGEKERWVQAEQALENSIKAFGLDYEVDEGGGAFYGPKIDVKIKDAIGREWQCSTIQFDFNLPERFDMIYIGNDGEKHRPFMIHRALLGSIERFFGILIEHYNGAFPVWLAPEQVRVLTVTDKQNEYARIICDKLVSSGVRAKLKLQSAKLGYKIREAQLDKIPYMIVLGEKEVENGSIAVRARDNKILDLTSLAELIEIIAKKSRHKE